MPSSVSLSTAHETLNFFNYSASGDVHYFLAVADWLEGSFDHMGFGKFPDDADIPVTLVCNLGRGRCSAADIQKLLARGAKVYNSSKLVTSIWALCLPDPLGVPSDPYASLDFAHCGTFSNNYLTLDKDQADMVVAFDDPRAHFEMLEFITTQINHLSVRVKIEHLELSEVEEVSKTRGTQAKPQRHSVRLVPARKDGEEFLEATIEMHLTSDGTPKPIGVTFGLFGGLNENSETCEPFMFRRDGTIDMGTQDEGSREVKTNLLKGKPVVPGEYFTFSWADGDEGTYLVKTVTLLP